MDFKAILTSLAYLIISADATVNDKELALARQMAKMEGMDEETFNKQFESLKNSDKADLQYKCVTALKARDRKQQVRSMAWLCVIANGDGFMDKEEWTLIYRIYHTELKLPMIEIMDEQKELNKIIHGKAFQSIGVRVNE
jgi:uncharacterized tellurite resistance protein B-like protein